MQEQDDYPAARTGLHLFAKSTAIPQRRRRSPGLAATPGHREFRPASSMKPREWLPARLQELRPARPVLQEYLPVRQDPAEVHCKIDGDWRIETGMNSGMAPELQVSERYNTDQRSRSRRCGAGSCSWTGSRCRVPDASRTRRHRQCGCAESSSPVKLRSSACTPSSSTMARKDVARSWRRLSTNTGIHFLSALMRLRIAAAACR